MLRIVASRPGLRRGKLLGNGRIMFLVMAVFLQRIGRLSRYAKLFRQELVQAMVSPSFAQKIHRKHINVIDAWIPVMAPNGERVVVASLSR